jgi:hypothetical protein
VRCALSESTTKVLEKWITASGLKRTDYLFPGGDRRGNRPMSVTQLNRLVKLWVVEARLDPKKYGLESLRRTKALHILKGTGDLQAVRNVVGTGQDRAHLGGFDRGGERIGRIGAGIDRSPRLEGKDFPLLVRIGRHDVMMLAAVRVGAQLSQSVSVILLPAQPLLPAASSTRAFAESKDPVCSPCAWIAGFAGMNGKLHRLDGNAL